MEDATDEDPTRLPQEFRFGEALEEYAMVYHPTQKGRYLRYKRREVCVGGEGLAGPRCVCDGRVVGDCCVDRLSAPHNAA